MDEIIQKKTRAIAEQFFGTANDPDQIPITEESFHKLQKLHPKTMLYRLENSEPISWVIVLPTSEALANQFLKGEITERELLNLSEPMVRYEALYLCSAFTVSEHRKKGLAIQLLKEAIDSIPHIENVKLFAWSYSFEGSLLVKKLERGLGVKIYLRK
jgi:hypothetical protein